MSNFSLGEAILGTGVDLEGLRDGLGQAESHSKGAIGKIGDVLKTGLTAAVAGIGLAVAGAVAGFGVAAFKAGQELDAAFDNIIIKTGATGAELDSLKTDFKSVFTSIPTDAESASSVLAILNTRLGLTGDTLTELTKPLLEATRLLGGDAKTNTELFTRVVGDWGVAQGDATKVLDQFFAASQNTGVGLDGLMGKVVQFGAPLRLMGFSLQDSIALFAKWEKEGVNSELVMGSLRIAAGKFADAGLPLRDSLLATFKSIKDNTDGSAALAEAMDVFGARAGPDMAAAIREGRFEFEDLLKTLDDSQGAILDTAAATADFGERWTVISNKITTALEPLGMAFLDVASTVLDSLMPILDKALPVVTAFMGSLADGIKQLMAGDFSALTNLIPPEIMEKVPALQKAIEALVAAVQLHFPEMIAAGEGFMSWIRQAFGATAPALMDDLIAIIQTLADIWRTHGASIIASVELIAKILVGTLGTALVLVVGIVRLVLQQIQGAFDFWSAVFQGRWSDAWRIAQNNFTTFFANIGNTLKTALNLILSIAGTDLNRFLNNWRTIFNMIGIIVKQSVVNLGDWILQGIANAVNSLRDVGQKFIDVGRNIIKGIISGMQSMIEQLVRTASSMAGQVISTFAGVFDMRSPSKVFADMGEMLMAGLDQGIEVGMTLPEQSLAASAPQLAAATLSGFGGSAKTAPTAPGRTVIIEKVVIENGMDLSQFRLFLREALNG